MNRHQTERHNNAIGGSLRFTRVCDSPEGHYDTPVLSENAAKIHLFMEKKGEMVKVTLPFWENVQTPAMDGRGRPTERRDGDAEHLFSPS